MSYRARSECLVYTAFACLFTALVSVAHAGAEIPRLRVPLITDVKVHVDARLAEPEWATQASRLVLDDFWGQETRGATRLEPTEVLLLATPEALHVAFLVEDAFIRVDPSRQHDGDTWRDDCVELFFALPEDRPVRAFGFEVNSHGAFADLRPRNVKDLSIDWNAPRGFHIVTRRVSSLGRWGAVATGAGWVMQMEIPWQVIYRSLYDPQSTAFLRNVPPHELRANFARWNHSAEGRAIFTIWSDSGLKIPKPHAPARFGWLVFEPISGDGEQRP